MKQINGKIYIQYHEAMAAGMPKGTIDSAVNRKSSSWSFIKDPDDNRRTLIEFGMLSDKYKRMIIAKYGEPSAFIAAQEITPLLIARSVDADLILNYQYDGKHLPPDTQADYIECCKYLYLLSNATCRYIKSKTSFESINAFTEAVISLIKAADISLPHNYSRLKHKIKEYKENGALSVISKRFGNQNSRKLGDVQLALVAQCYAKANQFGAERIADEYNKMAIEQGWKSITAQGILYNLKKPELKQQLLGPRKGVSAFREYADFSISRIRPSRPGMLWVGDGTPFELYYQQDGKTWMRLTVYVVIDAFNDYVVGYSIGHSESNALARLAWRNACVNTGVLPEQVKTDRFGLKEMRSYYSGIVKDESYFTPSKVGNARDKVVEQFFAQIRKQVVRDYFNHSGANITSKEQPNRDYLNAIVKEFPDEAGCIEQIHDCIQRWNTMPRKKLNGLSLENQWLNGDRSRIRLLDTRQRLEIFGLQNERTNRLTNKGIITTLEGSTRIYMLNDHAFMDTIGTDYTLRYDPLDLSHVLAVSPDGKFRFVIPEYKPVPMAFGDMQEGDRIRLNALLRLKEERIALNIERNKRQLALIEAEGLHKMFPLLNGSNKELMNESANALKQLSDPFDSDDINTVPVKVDKKDIWDED